MYDMDVTVLRNLLMVWTLSVGSALVTGLAPAWMRGAARRQDPSLVSALFGTAMALCCCGYALLRGGLRTPTGADIFFALLSGLLTALLWLCLFTALTGGIVNKVLPIVCLTNVLTAFFSSFFSGELLSTWQMCAIVLVLLGTLMIESRVKKIKGQYWMIYAGIAAAACTGLALIQQTRFAETDGSLFHLWRTLPACLLAWVLALVRGRHRLIKKLPKKSWTGTVFAALAVVLGWLLAGFIAGRRTGGFEPPMAALTFLFAMLFSRIVGKERQPGSAVFGACLMLAGMTLMTL